MYGSVPSPLVREAPLWSRALKPAQQKISIYIQHLPLLQPFIPLFSFCWLLFTNFLVFSCLSLLLYAPPPLVHSLRLSFCCRLWPLFFYSHHVSSLIILSLSWVCSSSVPFLVIFAHCQWFLQFLLIRPIFVLFLSACNPPPLCLLADSSRSQAGHRTMSACTSIIGCIMYTCVHTHIYTCTLCAHLLIPIPAFCIMGERT